MQCIDKPLNYFRIQKGHSFYTHNNVDTTVQHTDHFTYTQNRRYTAKAYKEEDVDIS